MRIPIIMIISEYLKGSLVQPSQTFLLISLNQMIWLRSETIWEYISKRKQAYLFVAQTQSLSVIDDLAISRIGGLLRPQLCEKAIRYKVKCSLAKLQQKKIEPSLSFAIRESCIRTVQKKPDDKWSLFFIFANCDWWANENNHSRPILVFRIR